MSRTFLTFGDIAGKLHMLRIECTRCARKGRYSVAKLLAQHGHRGNMSKWVSDLRGDCHKRNAAHLHERCDLICPDLPKGPRAWRRLACLISISLILIRPPAQDATPQ